jgi:hypothetical protein
LDSFKRVKLCPDDHQDCFSDAKPLLCIDSLVLSPTFRRISHFTELSNRKILVLSGKTSADFIEGFNISIGHLEIVAACLLASDYGTHCLNIDTTAFSVSGDYDADCDFRDMSITYGRPKDSRWDLKQFVLRMATNQRGIPLFLQTFSGNESDKVTSQIFCNLPEPCLLA